jgi:hypothetical protein
MYQSHFGKLSVPLFPYFLLSTQHSALRKWGGRALAVFSNAFIIRLIAEVGNRALVRREQGTGMDKN